MLPAGLDDEVLEEACRWLPGQRLLEQAPDEESMRTSDARRVQHRLPERQTRDGSAVGHDGGEQESPGSIRIARANGRRRRSTRPWSG